MNTVSTLCATSTVGIAVCGYALAQPCLEPTAPPPLASKTNRPSTARTSFIGSRKPFLKTTGPVELAHPKNLDNVPEGRPSTSRRFFRRISASLTPAPNNSVTSSVQTSEVSITTPPRTSWSRKPSMSFSRPFSRPSTANKLVKREPSPRLSVSRSNSPVPPPPRQSKRPSTGIHQPPARQQASNLCDSHLPRPSTSGQNQPFHPSSQNPPRRHIWRPYYPTQQKKTRTEGTPAKLRKWGGIRRIVPDLLRLRIGPTLVLATAVDATAATSAGDTFAEYSISVRSYAADTPSPPVSRMGETPTSPRQYVPRSSTAPVLTPNSERRSFSLSNFLGVPTPINSPGGKETDDENESSGFVGLSIADRRWSLSTPPSEGDNTSNSPYQQFTRSTTPAMDEPRREQLPPIQSLSVLELSLEGPAPDMLRTNDMQPQPDACSILEPHSPPTSVVESPSNNRGPQRSSIMSAERESTLVGSGSEHDFGSDTLFDSMRTRISDSESVNIKNIFKFDGQHNEQSANRASICDAQFGAILPVTPDQTPKKGITIMKTTPDSARTARCVETTRAPPLEDDDDDGWDSDWDVPSRPDDDRRFSNLGGLRPYSGLFAGSRTDSNNASSTSFDTAPEGYSGDGSSSRETNSILDWSEGVSAQSSSSPANSVYRPNGTTLRTKSSDHSFGKQRRSPHHLRAQSTPAVTTIRGKNTENWDDDFLNDESDGDHPASIVVPSTIQDNQSSIIAHLSKVRVFATRIEELKRMRETAVVKGIRYKPGVKQLWDEVDAVIIFAEGNQDPEENAPLRRDGLHRQNTWSPVAMRRRATHCSVEETVPSYVMGSMPRRNSVLSPEDEIFGGGHNFSQADLQPRTTTRKSSPLSMQSRRGMDVNDPARIVMEKIQHAQQHPPLANDQRGKFDFDNNTLAELLADVERLIGLLRKEPENNRSTLRLATHHPQPTPSTNSLDDFNFDLSPIRGSIDDSSITSQPKLGFNTVRVGIA